jgi:hypothetical protein
MFKIIIWSFLFYLAYRFIFELVIPISKTAGQLKKKMAEMQQQQAGYSSNQAPFQQQTTNQSTTSQSNDAPKKADYIDFEEVK